MSVEPLRVVVTGASSGIGRSLAERLVAAGHEVWGFARRLPAPVGGPGERRFRAGACDVSDWPAVARAADAVRAAGWDDGLDALVCAAGVQGAVGPAMTLDPEAWSQTVRVNLDGTFYSVAAFFPLLSRARRRAKVLCFSGGGATAPRPNFSAYAVAKTGVVRLVENLAAEWAGQPVDINAIAPGALPTRLTEETLALGPGVVGPGEHAAAQRTLAAGAAGLERVGALVDFLLSERSDGISGRLLSAPWDPWEDLPARRADLAGSDVFTLRRVVPADRGPAWAELVRP